MHAVAFDHLQVLMDSVWALRALLSELPTGELPDFSNDRALLGCNYLGCCNRRHGGGGGADVFGGVGEQELVLLPCTRCERPFYCSQECAEAAFLDLDHHHVACDWRS